MKKLILLFWIFSVYSFASLIGSNFSQRDLQVLEDLDIKSSFITNYKLQETYDYYRNRGNTHNYIEKFRDAALFVPRVKDVLRQEGIPDVFIYMAMAESNFDIDAKSNAKATGLWQFMRVTANRYNLRMDSYVDERMDLVKSTVAASRYLNSLYERFDKWYLAAISYNCGEGRMIEAITRATIDLFVEKFPSQKNSDRIKGFRKVIKKYQDKKAPFAKLDKVYKEVRRWNIKPDLENLLRVQDGFDRQYLPRESRNYIRKIISLAMMNSQSFITNSENSDLLNMGISTTVATAPVRGGLHLRNIAKVMGMRYKDLHALNKHLKRSIIPPNEEFYTINIPYSRLAVYNQNKEKIQGTKFAVHNVRKGDTLGGISKKYKVSMSEVKKLNRLKTNVLSINQELLLPIPSDMTRALAKSTKKVAKKSTKRKTIRYVVHTVKSGDTLGGLAYRYKTSMNEIRKKNRLKSDLLSINQKLILPVKNVKKTTKRHTVKSGDTLGGIARKYKVDIEKLMRDNKLKTHLLKIGDRLVIR